MDIDKKIVDRLDQLIKDGQSIKPLPRQAVTPGVLHFGAPVSPEKANQWGISCLNILRRVFGENSDHYKRFDALFDKLGDYTPVIKALGILKAAKNDYENGQLFETRALIQAEVFDDFLDQASHLLDGGYYAPAAVIAGGVLEDALRQLCQRKSISLKPKSTIDPMNVELAKAGIYNTLIQKRITALADVRNKAAHGKWTEISKEDVKDMIAQVRSFMEKHFT